jgi:hypothetical protein
VLALLAFAMLVVSLDQYIVVVALPDIGREQSWPSAVRRVAVAHRAGDRPKIDTPEATHIRYRVQR